MELLLNVLWLLLAVPAVWVWRREALLPGGTTRFSSLRCLLILSCTIMLLFPVVSATDDLHAMRPEMEESSPSKRVIKPATGGKSPVWLSGGVVSPAHLAQPPILCFNEQNCGKVVTRSLWLLAEVRSAEGAGRAPPISRLC
jgi:hypothetical protein